MKTLVFGFLTLVLFVFGGAPRGPSTLMVNKEVILEMMNEDRRAVAKEYKITNMHKLVWDESLAAKAMARDYTGNQQLYRTARLDGNEQRVDAWRKQFFMNGVVSDELKTAYNAHIDGMEQLIPHQKRVGCAPLLRIGGGGGITQTLCFLGPEGNGASWGESRGEPGSKCSDGYKNVDGLCALPEHKKAEVAEHKKAEEVASPQETIDKKSIEGSADAPGESNGYQTMNFSLMILGMTWFL